MRPVEVVKAPILHVSVKQEHIPDCRLNSNKTPIGPIVIRGVAPQSFAWRSQPGELGYSVGRFDDIAWPCPLAHLHSC